MKLNEIKNFFKKLISKKYVANITVLLAIAVIALIFTNDFFLKDSSIKNSAKKINDDILIEQDHEFKTEEEIIEKRLKQILEKIKGSGEVEVMVMFEMGSEVVQRLI